MHWVQGQGNDVILFARNNGRTEMIRYNTESGSVDRRRLSQINASLGSVYGLALHEADMGLVLISSTLRKSGLLPHDSSWHYALLDSTGAIQTKARAPKYLWRTGANVPYMKASPSGAWIACLGPGGQSIHFRDAEVCSPTAELSISGRELGRGNTR